MRWKDFHDRERQQIALELCIERLKRFEVDPENAIEMLGGAAEQAKEVLLEAAGLSIEEPGAESNGINPAGRDHHRTDPLLRYIDGLLQAAATGGPGPVVDRRDVSMIQEERALLNKPLADAFADLARRVPQLLELEAEVRSSDLEGPAPQVLDPASFSLVPRLLSKMVGYKGGPASYPPKAAFVLAVRERLSSLVGSGSSDSTDALARTDIAWEVARDHLLTLGGYPPERTWDEPRPPTAPPADQLRLLWHRYRDIREQKNHHQP